MGVEGPVFLVADDQTISLVEHDEAHVQGLNGVEQLSPCSQDLLLRQLDVGVVENQPVKVEQFSSV